MGVIERLTVSWEDASLPVVAVLAWLTAWLVTCPQVSIRMVSRAGAQITAAIPSLEPIMGSIEDDDREFQEDKLEPCALPGVRVVSPTSLAHSQITPPQSVSLSVLTLAQHFLRC
jgi:hypothetical protein